MSESTIRLIVILAVVAVGVGILIAVAYLRRDKLRRLDTSQQERIRNYLQTYHIVPSTTLTCANSQVIVSEPSSTLLVVNLYNDTEEYIPLHFSAIAGMSILQDGQEQGVVEGAIKGGLLFGRLGALIGAFETRSYIDNRQVVIYTNLLANPTVLVDVIRRKTTVGTQAYQEAEQFVSQCESVIRTIVARNN